MVEENTTTQNITTDNTNNTVDEKKTESTTNPVNNVDTNNNAKVKNVKKYKYSFEDKIFSFLSYCGPLIFLPFTMKSDKEFVQFHVRQGFVSCIFIFIMAIGAIIPFIGKIFGIISVITFFLSVGWGGYVVFSEKEDKIPFVSKYVEI